MKCTQCGGLAVLNMPQHRLKLCAEHLPAWVRKMVERTIAKYGMFAPHDRILVAVSGGKDSLTLWDVLIRLGYQTAGLYIHLGIDHHGYSDRSQEHAAAFAAQHGDLALHVVNVRQTYGLAVPELPTARHGRHMCSACGLVKRHIMNRMAYEGGYAAVATGHQLDDEAAVLMQNTLHWSAGYLRRQAPVLPATHPRLARKVKPLCHLYERETAAYALVMGLDYIDQECPHAQGAATIYYKGLLNQIEHRSPGAKLQFYLAYLRAKEEGLFAPASDAAASAGAAPDTAASDAAASDATASDAAEAADAMETCRQCGQPTVAAGLCAFCRLWQARPA
ncbi:MAG: tRNA 2-thiocytidine biosynthesis TtcA family protein [Chloroflexota bacterium]